MMAKYRCENCNELLDESEILISSWGKVPFGDTMIDCGYADVICPCCHGEAFEVVPCPICGEEYVPIDSEPCESCQKKIDEALGAIQRATDDLINTMAVEYAQKMAKNPEDVQKIAEIILIGI